MSATGLQNEAAVAARILEHIDRGSTDLGEATWREPVANYWSKPRFETELALMRRRPLPFCPSAALPNPGDYVARSAAGTPLVAIRGHDGHARVFRNACRHRGTALVSGSGCSRAFICPFHGWTYGLDGALRKVPHAHGFPDLVAADRSLAPVAAIESDGVIVVTQDGERVADGCDFAGANLVPPGWRLFRYDEAEIHAGWKVLAEGFLEGYHIRPTHRQTFFPLQYDNLNVVEHFGPHSRITYPYQSVERLRDVPPAERSGRRAFTWLYHLFPNVMLATFPAIRALVALEPLALDRTSILTWILTDGDDETAAAALALVDSGLREDRAMARAVQVGLSSGANTFLEFGLFESALTHFHRTLHAALGE